MRIAILGTGAIGGWFGGRLVEAGHDVVFVARGETLEVLQDRGLVLNDAAPIPVRAYGTLAEVPRDVDVVLLAVKVTAETDLAALLEGLPPSAAVALTQNSVEVPWLVADVVGKERTWPGVVRAYFHHIGPAQVEYHGGPMTYSFSPWDGSADERSEPFAAALREAGVDASVIDDIFSDVWLKAMLVTSTGALGALTDQPMAELRTRYRGSLEALMRETYETALANGIDMPTTAVADTLAFADRMPPEATSSMQRDLRDGRPNELDAQVGAICRMGELHGVDTRLHDLMLEVLG